jgi:two-component system sensor histidine kinase/response regulator
MIDTPARVSVLVVDDTVENLSLLSRMLTDHGYEARPVTSGRQALLAALSYPPAVILLDVGMPEMDGYEVCRQLRDHDELRDVPVIFLTALSDTADKLRAFEAGGVDFISKPFQVDEVLARIRVHIELRQSHVALAGAYQRLQALEQLRENLVQMVIHDMRSPLTSLIMLLDIVQERFGAAAGGDLAADLEAAIQAAAMANRMANDVLDVSRLEDGKLPLDRSRHDLAAICRDVVTRRQGLDRQADVAVDPGDAVEVDCDRGLVSRVIENLIGNAIKHTRPGCPIRIAVRAMPTHARVEVRDQGPGVPAPVREAIFEKFGTLEARNDGAIHSAGLGLAFCKLAVEAHGGRIGVEPGVPVGAVFWFELPA